MRLVRFLNFEDAAGAQGPMGLSGKLGVFLREVRWLFRFGFLTRGRATGLSDGRLLRAVARLRILLVLRSLLSLMAEC